MMAVLDCQLEIKSGWVHTPVRDILLSNLKGPTFILDLLSCVVVFHLYFNIGCLKI